jgi:VRR-NUC domain
MNLCPEDIDHINIVNWFHKEFPDLADDFYHFANERRCSMQQGRLLKRKGVKRGVADFFLALPSNGKSGLWIELKVGEGKLSPEQKKFLARMLLRGFDALAVWGEDAAKAVILAYLKRGVDYGQSASDDNTG